MGKIILDKILEVLKLLVVYPLTHFWPSKPTVLWGLLGIVILYIMFRIINFNFAPRKGKPKVTIHSDFMLYTIFILPLIDSIGWAILYIRDSNGIVISIITALIQGFITFLMGMAWSDSFGNLHDTLLMNGGHFAILIKLSLLIAAWSDQYVFERCFIFAVAIRILLFIFRLISGSKSFLEKHGGEREIFEKIETEIEYTGKEKWVPYDNGPDDYGYRKEEITKTTQHVDSHWEIYKNGKWIPKSEDPYHRNFGS